MSILDIIGPVMVGPSSSHTAGAARIGRFARLLLGAPPERAAIGLHGSFAATGEGHGTPLALLAGLLGLAADDERIPEARALAETAGLSATFQEVDLGEVHPNSVRLELDGRERHLAVCASSVGGGRIQVWRVDGFPVALDGAYPTLLLVYPDQRGVVSAVTALLAEAAINIATVKVGRTERGGRALMELQMDQAPEPDLITRIQTLPGMAEVRFIPALES